MTRLSRKQVREVDRIAIEEYGIPGIVLMENAARSAVEAIVERHGPAKDLSVAVVCGGGNNGGDGYAMARHLCNRGARVVLFDDGPPQKQPDAFINRDVAKQMGIAVASIHDLHRHADGRSLIIDALFGTGLSQPVRDPWNRFIEQINDLSVPVCAIDLPSGLDCDTGEPLGDACVIAEFTVTFVAAKLGFANPTSRKYTGDVVVGDIGCPREIIEHVRTE